MARGRFLSKSISSCEELSSTNLSGEAVILFVLMIPHLDREGRISGNPTRLKAIAAPLRDELTPEKVRGCLAELVQQRLLVWYRVGDVTACSFPGFSRNQPGLRKQREAPSVYPGPEHKDAIRLPQDSGPTPELSGPTPGLRVKSEVRSVKKESNTVAPATAKEEARPMPGLMQLIRDVLYAPDGKPSEGWEIARCGSIVKQLLKVRRAEDIAAAIEGLGVLRKYPGMFGDRVDWLERGDKLTMRCLYNSRSGVMPMFERATSAYWKRFNTAGKPKGERSPQRVDPSAILDRVANG